MPASAEIPTIRPSPAIAASSAASSVGELLAPADERELKRVFRRDARSSEPVRALATIVADLPLTVSGGQRPAR